MKFHLFIFLLYTNILIAQYSHSSSYFATDHAFLPKPKKLMLECKMGLWNQLNYSLNKNISVNGGVLFDAFDTPIEFSNIYPQVGIKAKVDFHELIHAGMSSTLFLSFNYDLIGGVKNNHYNFNQVFITLGNPKNNLSIGSIIYYQNIEGDFNRYLYPYLSAIINIKNDFNIMVENAILHNNISSLGFGFSFQKNRLGITFGLIHPHLGNEYNSSEDYWTYLKIPVISMRYYLTK